MSTLGTATWTRKSSPPAMLAEAGATLVAADIDEGRRTLADIAGATWTSPQDCLTADVDVLVPAALGGLLTPHTVPTLRCAAIAGPANNQLGTPATADLLHQHDILWAPDIIVSAGGIIHATAVELHQETSAQATARVQGIADTLADILRTARATGSTPAAAARSRARHRIGHRRRPHDRQAGVEARVSDLEPGDSSAPR